MKRGLGAWAKPLAMALPLLFGWTIYTAQPTPGNILLGYLFGVLAIKASGLKGESLRLRSAPKQLYNLLAYIVFLASEVLFSGLKVARIVLTPSLPIQPGISKINTQDASEDELISAVSAHAITITPGELVVDFEETNEDGLLMVVHSLNMETSGQSLHDDQRIRLKRIKGILGHD